MPLTRLRCLSSDYLIHNTATGKVNAATALCSGGERGDLTTGGCSLRLASKEMPAAASLRDTRPDSAGEWVSNPQ